MRALMSLGIVRVTALALCVGGPLAAPLRAQDTAEVANLVVYRIAPSAIDSTSRRFDAANYVVSLRAVKADAPLLVFLPGTGGRPLNTTAFENLAAHQGYRVIGLEYDDEPAVQQICPRNPDPGCAEKVRRKRIFGEDATSLIDDKPNESIVARLAALLAALNRDHPSDGWSRYLNNGQPNWPSIAVSGLSQGAGMAAYIAQRTLVARVILFSSPWDSYGRFRTLAPWVTRGPGATPPERWYGAFHRNENTADLIQRAYAALHIPSDHVRVLTLEPVRKVGDNPYHPSVVGNGVTPRLPNGAPAYLEDWRVLLGDVR